LIAFDDEAKVKTILNKKNKKVVVTINNKILEVTKEQREVLELRNKGLTNDEIAEKLNVERDVVYSRLYRVKKRYEKMFKEDLDISSYEDEDIVLEDQSELEFLRHQVRHLKTVVNKYKKGDALEERLIQLFDDSIRSIAPRKVISEKKKNTKLSEEELVLCVGDVHAGEVIESEEVMGLNYYNMDVMKKRMEILYNRVNAIVDKMQGYRHNKLHIFFLGDMVSGLIHEELLAGTAVVDQVVETGYILSEMIEKWGSRFKEIDVSAVVGNHGRLQKQVRYKKKYDNFDYLMYHIIRARCKDLSNVDFAIPKSQFLIKQIYDYNFLLTHGDSKVQSYAGIPFYGIRRMDTNITQTLVAEKNIFPHYTVIGHFHSNNTLDKAGMGKIIMNGSMIGTSDFALNRMFVSGEPKQTLFSVHKDYGVTCKFDVLFGPLF
jgi:hypothetical protein